MRRVTALLLLACCLTCSGYAQSPTPEPAQPAERDRLEPWETWRLRRDLRDAQGAVSALTVQVATVRAESADLRRRLEEIEGYISWVTWIGGGLITLLFGPHGKTVIQAILAARNGSKRDDGSGN